MICPYCNKEAKFCENKEIYGKNYGKSYMCYYCAGCNAYVGCHQNTDKPLGTIANKELRDLRKKAHSLFDPMWQGGKMKRKEAYKLLEEKTGVKHISWTDIDSCKKLINQLSKIT